jgi:hypothetical protein
MHIVKSVERSTMPRRAAKVDANQRVIVDVLRANGASVTHTHQIGKGFPDIVVGYRGNNYLMEIKDGDKAPSQRKLTPDEEAWHLGWRGTVNIVDSPERALEVIRET